MIETLGEAHDLSWRIHARCAQGKLNGLKQIPECFWKADLDMVTLTATRGRAFPLSMLQSRLKCPRCGSPNVRVAFDPPGHGLARMGGR